MELEKIKVWSRASHNWFLICIILLTVATMIGFSITHRNFLEDERIDRHACELATENRLFIKDTLELVTSDPKIDEDLRARLTNLEKEVKILIEASISCS